jgi:hypothetical protein
MVDTPPEVGPINARGARSLPSRGLILRHLAGATSGKSHDLTRTSRKTLKWYEEIFEEKSNCKNGLDFFSGRLICAGIGSPATTLQAWPPSDLPGHRADDCFLAFSTFEAPVTYEHLQGRPSAVDSLIARTLHWQVGISINRL